MTVFVAPPLLFASCAPAPSFRRFGYRSACMPCASGPSCFFTSALFFVLHSIATGIFKIGSCLASCCARPEECSRATNKTPRATDDTSSVDRKHSRRDLSSVRVVDKVEELMVAIAAPGVRPSDLSVSVHDDNAVHVTGKSTKNGTVFVVDRRIALPSAFDVSTLTAAHADGELVVTVRRRAGKRIPIFQREPIAATDKAEPAASHAPPEPAAASLDASTTTTELADDARPEAAQTTTEGAASALAPTRVHDDESE